MNRLKAASIACLLLFVFISWAYAQSGTCTGATCGYIPMIENQPTLTPIPPTATPIPPPPINTLTIQLSDMKPGYTLDESTEITNADAAKGYPNPKAALQAFATQGRETAWYIRYTSTDYLFSDALAVADEVYRYTTSDGAYTGQNYVLLEVLREHPEYQPFNTGGVTTGFRRTFTDSGYTFVQFYMSTPVGRYVIDVQVIALADSLVDAERALEYNQIALERLGAAPQGRAQMATESAAHPLSKVIPDALQVH